MPVVVLGISHRTAPMGLLGAVLRPGSDLERALARTREDPAFAGVERVLLGTCNRLEAYLALPDPVRAPDLFVRLLKGMDVDLRHEALAPHLYHREGEEAVRHLFRVACGLDSLVLGDQEVGTQVVRAWETAHRLGVAGPRLAHLFQIARRVGKRARATTAIAWGPSSVAGVAVRLARARLGDLAPRRCLVAGTGVVGRAVLHHLQAQGAQHLAVVSRDPSRARTVAEPLGARWAGLDALPDLLAWADLAFLALAVPAPLLGPADLAPALARRNGHPLLLLDLGLPPNADPAVGALPGLLRLGLEDLTRRVREGQEVRERAVPAVSAQVERAVEGWRAWERERAVAPLLDALHRWGESVRREAVAHALRRHPGLSPEAVSALESATWHLVRRLLQPPARTLTERARRGEAGDLPRALADLFALPSPQPEDADEPPSSRSPLPRPL